jgi:glycine cleavage system H protein
MSEILPDLKYTKDHEYVKVDGELATIGLTDHAQHELTEIVFVELPTVGKEIGAGDVVANVESVKTVTEVFAPVSGVVKQVNDKLVDSTRTRTARDGSPSSRCPMPQGWRL